LGHLAFGEDRWWNPSDDATATQAAIEVIDLMTRYGVTWLDRLSDPHTAITEELAQSQPNTPLLIDGFVRQRRIAPLFVAASLLVERVDDPRRVVVRDNLIQSDIMEEDRSLRDWLIGRLSYATTAGTVSAAARTRTYHGLGPADRDELDITSSRSIP
jgi:hypothetical protein